MQYPNFKPRHGLRVSTLTDKFIQVNMSREELPQLVAQLTAMDIGIISILPRHSLEDYFLSLTNLEANVEPFTN